MFACKGTITLTFDTTSSWFLSRLHTQIEMMDEMTRVKVSDYKFNIGYQANGKQYNLYDCVINWFNAKDDYANIQIMCDWYMIDELQ